MLVLDDSLWRKLDDAHRDRDIAGALARLDAAWDPEAASSLLWDCLCHQDTCYGATYAAVPHLITIAERERGGALRDVAFFLGHVARVAFKPMQGFEGEIEDSVPQGLPDTLAAWDRKLDPYRCL